MRRLLALALLALALPGAAAAKGITAVELCGPEACATAAFAEPVHEWPGDPARQVSVPPAAPFLELRLLMGGHVERLWYVPSARLVATRPSTWVEWRPLTGREIDRAVAAAAVEVAPFPRPRVVAARVDGEPVDASVVDAVFDAVRPGKAAAWDERSMPVSLTWSTGNPWEAAEVRWFPGTRLWQRGDDAKLVARELRRGDGGGAGSLPWLVPAALAAAVLLLAGANRLAGRSRGRIRTA